MKTLSLIQPWASLVIGGSKRIETRSWKTDHRGPIAIHASKKRITGIDEMCMMEPFRSALREQGFKTPADLPKGAILGTVVLTDCKLTEDLNPTDDERAFGDFGHGRYGWLLASPKRWEKPFAYRGELGLFEIAEELCNYRT